MVLLQSPQRIRRVHRLLMPQCDAAQEAISFNTCFYARCAAASKSFPKSNELLKTNLATSASTARHHGLLSYFLCSRRVSDIGQCNGQHTNGLSQSMSPFQRRAFPQSHREFTRLGRRWRWPWLRERCWCCFSHNMRDKRVFNHSGCGWRHGSNTHGHLKLSSQVLCCHKKRCWTLKNRPEELCLGPRHLRSPSLS